MARWVGPPSQINFRNGITMATDAPVQIPRARISELIEREEKQLN
jgi:glutamate-1-semialdehyde 2,1-aminomutase